MKLGPLFLVSCLFVGAASAQGPEPHPLKTPTIKRNLYPDGVDAKKEIAEAIAAAAKSNKRVLLVFGANWCLDCHILDNALHSGQAGKIANTYYELVHVDVGRYDKNLDIAKKYEVDLDKGVPNVAVLSAQGKLLYSSSIFEAARKMDEQQVIDFLNTWKPSKKQTAQNK